jgi:hypothetical protein
VRAVVARAEPPPPFAGAAVAGKAPPPNLTPQHRPTPVVVARGADPLPFAGLTLARLTRLVPSDRLPPRPLVARAEPPEPFPGLARVGGGRAPPPQPARVLVAIAAPPLPLLDGRALARTGRPEPRTPQQLRGRVVVASAEPPLWLLGGSAVLFPRAALMAAAGPPPSLTGARPGGRFVRADAGDRSIRRLPRMGSTLTYVTRTKTPDEILAVVFDFSNFPEVVGGATLVGTPVVSGPGGEPLSGLVAGTPAVLATAATVDAIGGTVAAGKGVEVALAGGGAGEDVIVQCAATLSTGSRAVVQGKIAVRNAA